jgi:hypothetical protein
MSVIDKSELLDFIKSEEDDCVIKFTYYGKELQFDNCEFTSDGNAVYINLKDK